MRAVDTHFHWFPRAHFEKLAVRAEFPRAERDGDGYKYYYNSGASQGRLWPAWFDLEAGLAASDAAVGDEVTVLATAGVLSGLIDSAPLADAVDLATDYNEELAKMQRTRPGRFYGSAVVPLADTREALAITDHAINGLGLRAVNLPPVTTDAESIDSPRLEPFYSLVEELGVPLLVHPTDFVFADVLEGYDFGLQRSLGRLVDSSVTVLRLIFSGIMERHPALTVFHTHAGGVLPYQAGRLDKNARIKGLPELPSTYLKRTFTDIVAPQALTIRTAVEFYGIGHVMYGTDYPCWSPAAAMAVLGEAGLTEADTARLLHGNAEDVLGLQGGSPELA